MTKRFCIEVSGDFACFTRPELKAEPVSYDVITPSAARGVFTAIFWKPALEWAVAKIEVVNQIKWFTMRRNEVGETVPDPVRKGWLGSPPPQSARLYASEVRQQRSAVFLRDVKYRIHADMLYDHSKDQNGNHQKMVAMFTRRASKGQCFKQPYLGSREFSCDFRLIDLGKIENEPPPFKESKNLGWMLYGMDYSDESDPQPMFFDAEMRDGVIDVPSRDSGKVRK